MVFLIFLLLVILCVFILFCSLFEKIGYKRADIVVGLVTCSLIVLACFLLLVLSLFGLVCVKTVFSLYGFFYVDGLIVFSLFFLALGFSCFIFITLPLIVKLNYMYESVFFCWFSFIGLCLALCSYDFLLLYVSLELSTLSLYVLVSYNNDSLKSAEAGLKYFILGSMSSAFFLFGISIIYGFSGTLNFGKLFLLFQTNTAVSEFYAQFLLGLGFILVSFLFKLGVFPFHGWVPDVYQGGSVFIIAFLSTLPKWAYLVIFLKIIFFVFAVYIEYFYGFLLVISILSVIIGCIGSLGVYEVKRLLGYGSITNLGFVIFTLLSFSYSGVVSVFFFMFIYIILLFSVFCILISNLSVGICINSIYDLSNCGGCSRKFSLVLSFYLLSFAGIPPLAGFFGKVSMLQAVMSGSDVLLNFLVFFIMFFVVPMVVFVYLRLVAIIWFGKISFMPFFYDYGTWCIIFVGGIFNWVFIIFGEFLYDFFCSLVFHSLNFFF